MLLYISGKVSKDSSFGKENWRDEFVSTISKLSGLRLSHLDPLAYENDKEYDPQFVFDKDCALINKADCVVVYLSDDISVGGSQEMMIAKYLNKPLIGLAPRGGKFNCDKKWLPVEMWTTSSIHSCLQLAMLYADRLKKWRRL